MAQVDRCKQRGVTLVELLLGLLLSSIAVAGMLLAFRGTLQATARAIPAAIEDSERIAMLLTSHLSLQTAGYGVETPALGTDLLRFDNLAWAPSGNGGSLQTIQAGQPSPGDGVIWSSDTDLDGVFDCEGVVPSTTGGAVLIRGQCANASGWQAVQNWTATDLLGELGPASTSAELEVAINVAAACSPVGAGDPATDMLRGVPASVSVSLSTGISVTSSTCLYNFSAAAP